jgi:ArsR family transcriptional regulator
MNELTQMFKALGDEVRLGIVALLSHGELCVCHVESALSLTRSNASRQLAILRSAGLVTADRRDKWVYYRLAPQTDPARARHLKVLIQSFTRRDDLRRQAAKVMRRTGPTCR